MLMTKTMVAPTAQQAVATAPTTKQYATPVQHRPKSAQLGVLEAGAEVVDMVIVATEQETPPLQTADAEGELADTTALGVAARQAPQHSSEGYAWPPPGWPIGGGAWPLARQPVTY